MRFRERLTPPLAWWLLLLAFALSMAVAFFFPLGPIWAIGVGLAIAAIGTAIFLGMADVVEVTEDRLTVGRAWIDLRYVADAISLDADQAWRRRGPDADTHAYLVLKPYLKQAVEIDLNDTCDPAPYWLVATRRPKAFAAAIHQAVSA